MKEVYLLRRASHFSFCSAELKGSTNIKRASCITADCVCAFMCVSEWVIILTVLLFLSTATCSILQNFRLQVTKSSLARISAYQISWSQPHPFAHPLHAGRVWYLVALVCTQLPQICKPLCNPLIYVSVLWVLLVLMPHTKYANYCRRCYCLIHDYKTFTATVHPLLHSLLLTFSATTSKPAVKAQVAAAVFTWTIGVTTQTIPTHNRRYRKRGNPNWKPRHCRVQK